MLLTQHLRWIALFAALAATGCGLLTPERPQGAACVRYEIVTSRVHLGGDRWSEPRLKGYVAYGDLLFNDQVKGGAYAACPPEGVEPRDVAGALLADLERRVPPEAHRDGPRLVALEEVGPSATRAGRHIVKTQMYRAYFAGCPFVRLDGKHGHRCEPSP
jgi:hypothetical protein